MNKPAALITLKRKKTSSYQIRQFAITIDDNVIGKIKSGETKQFKVPVGSHAIGIKIDLYKSEPLRVDLKPDQTLDLECGDRSPENIREAFTLKGMEKSLNSLIKPKQYLYVQQVGNTVPQLTPHSAKSTIKPSKKAPKQRKSCTVFISYRRGDSREITGRICDRLSNEFGKQTIFRDVDSIPAGVDFRKHINKTIDQCSMLVAIIGDKWLEAKNKKGERRLDLSNDHLRVEIETALKKEIPVIPVLVKKGIMPDEDDLPEGLKPLAYRNAIPIPEEPFFHNGVDLLINEMNKVFSPSEPVREQKGVGFCIYCGNEIMPGNKFCIHCGNQV
ncbi:MAG: TIR domain-containing protein [Candidatus Thiodiazotropha endolucinida]